MPAMIEVRDVVKSFGPLEVLKGVSFDVAQGEVAVIIGSSGSGKSTILRCINFLEDFESGRILVVVFDDPNANGKRGTAFRPDAAREDILARRVRVREIMGRFAALLTVDRHTFEADDFAW